MSASLTWKVVHCTVAAPLNFQSSYSRDGAAVDITFLCHLISVVAVAEDFGRPSNTVFKGVFGTSRFGSADCRRNAGFIFQE